MKVKQTAGRDSMGDFAPAFARLNDDVLFGEVWSEETLSLKTRSLLTVSALIGKGMVDESLRYHLETAKRNGVTREEMAETLTGISHFMRDGRMPGRRFAWQKKFMPRGAKRRKDAAVCSGSVGRTTLTAPVLRAIPI